MSEQDELIYNLMPRGAAPIRKPPKHVSRFKNDTRNEMKKSKADHKTFGFAKEPLRQPDDYLKRHEGDFVAPDSMKCHEKDEHRKAPIPSKDDKPVMGLRTNKDFITQNALENIRAVPKKPEKIYVDTRKGDKHSLPPSGLEPVYTRRKDFAKKPAYLSKREEELRRNQEFMASYAAQRNQWGAMQQLSEEECYAILEGLKSNWEKLHHEYQSLSVVTDTAPKKMRKERLEAEMKQLEKDIQIFERNNAIYIGN